MLKTLAAGAVLAALALLPTPAHAIDRPPMKSCGDFIAANGLHFVGQVAPELRLARCSKFGEGDPLFKTVRFEFGS